MVLRKDYLVSLVYAGHNTAAVRFADRVNTVSPTYAADQTPAYGETLEACCLLSAVSYPALSMASIPRFIAVDDKYIAQTTADTLEQRKTTKANKLPCKEVG